MEIELIEYEKDNCVRFRVGKREEQAYLIDYDLTDGSKLSLESVFFPYQVKHIAEELKNKMLVAENEKTKSESAELPPIDFEYKSDSKPAPLEKEIRAVCDEMASFLIEKNKAYGNSAAEPAGIFAKRINPLDQIDVRIDDKINRLMKGNEYPGDDTIIDLTGYLILRMIVARAS